MTKTAPLPLNPTILVVDDNPVVLTATVHVLEKAGYVVAEAIDGTSALLNVRAQRPRLVLLDVMLPDICGLDVLKEIRADPDLLGVAVVLMSAYQIASPEQAHGLDAGADDYIARPVANAELLARVRSQLRQQDLSEHLRASEKRYRRLFESAKDGILILDAETGIVEDVNPFLQELLGFSHEQFLKKAIWELGSFKDIVANAEKFSELKAKQYVRYENLPMETIDGKTIAVEFVSNVYLVEGSKVVQCNVRDITERRRVEDALEASERSFGALVRYMQIGLVSHGPDTSVVFANPMACTLLGLTADQLCGKPATDPDWDLVRRDGTKLPASEYPVNRAIQSEDGEIRDLILGINRPDRQAPIWVQCNCHVIRNPEGRLQQILVTFADITELEGATAALNLALAETEGKVTQRTKELKSANKELLVVAERADAANRAKSEFLSHMSHELRTPMNSILGFGQVLEDQELTPLQRESLDFILKGGRHLLNLINEVLDIAKVESGHIDISVEPVSIEHTVGESCSLMRPLAAERDVRLEIATAPEGPTHVMADAQRLKQVLLNIISNAIKYNREGGRVDVSWEAKDEARTLIHVRDTGLGIKPENMAKLFTPFERLGFSNSEIEGTGLGLALSQRLVNAMGGHLSAASTLYSGSVFTVELARATDPSQEHGRSDHLIPDRAATSSRPYSVLAIEDNPTSLRLLEVIISRRPDIELLSALQGSLGLDLARQHVPDLILLDLNLPDLAGQRVLGRLREDESTRRIPVVVVSADATPSQIDALLRAGATAYVTKPLDVVRLLALLDELLPVI
jgi:PAS domain S-box-containing protein